MRPALAIAALLLAPLAAQGGEQTFTGKIMHRGHRYVLQDSAGRRTWRLDDQNRARTFAGENVTVTGTYVAASRTIHVRDIRGSVERSPGLPPEVAHPDPTGPITPPTFPSRRPKDSPDANPVKPADPTKPTTTKPLG